MSSFTTGLIPDEQVLAVATKNWTFFFSIKNIIGTLIALVLLPIFFPLSLIILAVLFIPTVLEYKNTELVLTNMRLRGRQGAFNVRTVENQASYFCGNVKTSSNVILSSLGTNNIVIASGGVSRGDFTFTHMKNADAIINALYSLEHGKEVVVRNF